MDIWFCGIFQGDGRVPKSSDERHLVVISEVTKPPSEKRCFPDQNRLVMKKPIFFMGDVM